jgi:hypothetical protein
MRTDRWASIRTGVLVVILCLQSVALAGLALSFLVIGSIAGSMLDEFLAPGSHRITITMIALGTVCSLACALAALGAIAIGGGLGYRGSPHAVFWRAVIGVAAALQVGWIVMVATSSVDPGAGNRIGWAGALVLGACAAWWCVSAFRERARTVATPPPPAPLATAD